MRIAEFLLARIADDEDQARRASRIPEGTEQTASVRRPGTSGWRSYDSNGKETPVQAPARFDPDAPLDQVGDWGWNGGPPDADTMEMLVKMFGEDARRPSDSDKFFRIVDSGLWDETDELGASFTRALVPVNAEESTARHIASWSPVRVLAECASKRAIVERGPSECGAYVDQDKFNSHHYPDPAWGHCDGCSAAESADNDWLWTLRMLARPYADHPDYLSTWTASPAVPSDA